MSQRKQPAKVSLFFGPGWKKIIRFDKRIWKEAEENISELYSKGKSAGIYSFAGLFSLIGAVIAIPVGVLYSLLVMVIFSITMTVYNLLSYVGFALTWVIDKLYFQITRVHMVCPYCKEMHKFPAYACPSCGTLHDELVPGKYGILHRKCRCGQKMSSSVLSGRKKLQAYCPFCKQAVSDRENLPISISVIGGRSVGKTAYITALAKTFFDKIAMDNGWTAQHYNADTQLMYQTIKEDYNAGTTRMTETVNDSSKPSAIAFSFLVKGRGIFPERVIHIYDIAGETFVENTENEVQKQYNYCQGLILILDPYSIPTVYTKYQSILDAKDRTGIGRTDSMSVVEAFLNKIREMTALSATKKIDIPLAIVLSKTDSAGIKDEISKEKIHKEYERICSQYKNLTEMDVEDYLCRRFLQKYEMQNLLNTIDFKFSNTHYFSCSAIGHPREQGAYSPTGVLEPFAWIMQQSDPVIGKHILPGIFGKVRIDTEDEL